MPGSAAVASMQEALRRNRADAVAHQAQASIQFHRFMACLRRPPFTAQAPR